MDSLQQKNKKVMRITFGVVFFMIALSFASVPLYRMICQVTGWGGTTKMVAENNSKVFDRVINVQFNADVDPRMPWSFKPDLHEVSVKVGATGLISYSAVNKSNKPVTGTAIYNVTPYKAAKYFNKTECFCFGYQALEAGQKGHFPVAFFIDPKIMDDQDLDDVKSITLSYTFYRHDSPELENATKKFYSDPQG